MKMKPVTILFALSPILQLIRADTNEDEQAFINKATSLIKTGLIEGLNKYKKIDSTEKGRKQLRNFAMKGMKSNFEELTEMFKNNPNFANSAMAKRIAASVSQLSDVNEALNDATSVGGAKDVSPRCLISGFFVGMIVEALIKSAQSVGVVAMREVGSVVRRFVGEPDPNCLIGLMRIC